MAVYCISYGAENDNHGPLTEAIKSYGSYWYQSKSTWLIETSQTSREVLDNLKNYTIAGDKLLVIQVKKNWWAIGHKSAEYDWLKKRKF